MFTVLWDNDGVLVDTEGLFFQATKTILATVGVNLTQEQYIEASLRRGTTNFDLAAAQGVSADEIRRLRAERDELYSKSLRVRKCVIEGVEAAMRRLHGRIRMGVVTSSRRVHFDIAHAESGLLPLLDFVLAREDYDQAKPHPEPYLTALRRFDLQPDRCIVIEDSERGLMSAAAAGLRCLVIPSEWTRDGDFRAAWKVLQSVEAVPEEVFRLCDAKDC
jgi:HAD superfamily hydrolase (TIGR01509 family)